MTLGLCLPPGGVARAAAAAQARACAGRGDTGRAAVAAEAAAAEGERRPGLCPRSADPSRSMRKMLLAALTRILQGPAAAGRTVSAGGECGPVPAGPGPVRAQPCAVWEGRGRSAGNSPGETEGAAREHCSSRKREKRKKN